MRLLQERFKPVVVGMQISLHHSRGGTDKSEDLTKAMWSCDPYVDHGGFCLRRYSSNAGLRRYGRHRHHHKPAIGRNYDNNSDNHYDTPLTRSVVVVVEFAHFASEVEVCLHHANSQERILLTVRPPPTTPFARDESSRPPPHFVRDIISGDYQIYHRGEMRPAKLEEVEGLERQRAYCTTR